MEEFDTYDMKANGSLNKTHPIITVSLIPLMCRSKETTGAVTKSLLFVYSISEFEALMRYNKEPVERAC